MALRLFRYYGAKAYSTHLNHILPRLPRTNLYIEPFIGSGSIYLNKQPRSAINILNDIDSRIVNVFKCLRDQPDEFVRLLALTPCSRTEYDNAKSLQADNDLELARQTFIMLEWAFAPTIENESRGMSLPQRNGSYHRWLPSVAVTRLAPVIQALADVVLENRPALDILKRYKDSRNTLIYCDPPYLHTTRNSATEYGNEMTTEQHVEFLKLIQNAQAQVCISSYRNDLYDDYLNSWYSYDYMMTQSSGGHAGGKCNARPETLYMNYPPIAGALF